MYSGEISLFTKEDSLFASGRYNSKQDRKKIIERWKEIVGEGEGYYIQIRMYNVSKIRPKTTFKEHIKTPRLPTINKTNYEPLKKYFQL